MKNRIQKHIQKHILTLILGFSVFTSNGQIAFSSVTYDFGTLSNWSQTPAIFEFENTGNTQEAFLNTIRSSNIHVKYPTSYIQPGEKGMVLIYFEPLTIGHFNEQVRLFVGSSPDPIVFTIKGIVSSYLECPSVNMPADPSLLFSDHSGIIVSRNTKKPIEQASILFINSSDEKSSVKANREGRFTKKLKLGMYTVKVSAEGYHRLDELIYLNKNTNELVFQLTPLDEFEHDTFLTYEPTDTVEENNPILEQKSTQESVKNEDKLFSLEGVVVDEYSGEPVNKASIKLLNIDNKTPYVYRTYKDGKFKKQLDPGLYWVTIQAPEYELLADTFFINSSDNSLVFKLKPEAYLIEIITEVVKDSLHATDVPKVGMNKIENKTEIAESADILPRNFYAANNIVFLVDVSSSMNKRGKLENLKTSMIRLTEVLREIDLVSLISYSTQPHTVFTSLPADEKDTIIASIDSLKAGGLTYGVRGLESAYKVAESKFIEDGNNQVIIATDGEFNSPDYSEVELIAMITKYARKGIIISVVGFGTNEQAIRRMKRMAAFGQGNFMLIEDETQAASVLIEEIKANSTRERSVK